MALHGEHCSPSLSNPPTRASDVDAAGNRRAGRGCAAGLQAGRGLSRAGPGRYAPTGVAWALALARHIRRFRPATGHGRPETRIRRAASLAACASISSDPENAHLIRIAGPPVLLLHP